VEVYNKGWKVNRPSFTIFGLPNELGRCRLGLTVTRKVGSAVSRNRVKRVLRDCFRRNRAQLAVGLDLVVNARPSILRTPGTRLERELVDGIAELVRRIRP
jgi:ribonuclease P protein component